MKNMRLSIAVVGSTLVVLTSGVLGSGGAVGGWKHSTGGTVVAEGINFAGCSLTVNDLSAIFEGKVSFTVSGDAEIESLSVEDGISEVMFTVGPDGGTWSASGCLTALGVLEPQVDEDLELDNNLVCEDVTAPDEPIVSDNVAAPDKPEVVERELGEPTISGDVTAPDKSEIVELGEPTVSGEVANTGDAAVCDNASEPDSAPVSDDTTEADSTPAIDDTGEPESALTVDDTAKLDNTLASEKPGTRAINRVLAST